MASLNETPRQKMISILYLVLLGLIATNISDSVLEAFKNLTASLATSINNVNGNVQNTFASFEATKLKDEPQRARPIYDRAKQVAATADELDNYIGQLKKLFEEKGGGYNKVTGDLNKRDNIDIAYRLMINQGRGKELKAKINDTRAKLYAALGTKDVKGVNFPLEAVDPPAKGGIRETWELVNFGDGVPLTAAMTTLTKIRADLKNSEYEVVKRILGQMDQAVINLDQFSAVAVAPTSYVIQGQPYNAEVFLTASDSRSVPVVTVDGQSLPIKDGKGQYSVNTSREGMFTWSGIIRVKQTDGTTKEYRTPDQKYQVAKPSAVVSPDKMNVFYIGVPNPVSVSAPGISKESLKVSMSGGSISGSNGQYTVNVSQLGNAKVVVSAEVAPGKVQTISTSEFRVKRIPDPRVKFGGKTGGTISGPQARATNKLFAALDNFDFDAKFNIERFSLVVVKPRADATVLQGTGSTLSPAMVTAMGSITPGTRIIFDNIIATGPDGLKRQLDPVSLIVQ